MTQIKSFAAVIAVLAIALYVMTYSDLSLATNMVHHVITLIAR